MLGYYMKSVLRRNGKNANKKKRNIEDVRERDIPKINGQSGPGTNAERKGKDEH